MAGKKQQNGRVPKGGEFMGGTSTDDIRAALKKEKRSKDLKAARVLLACPWRRNGRDGTWIADTTEQPRSTIYDWLTRMHRGGLDACHDLPIPGRPLKIKPEIHPEISKMIDGQPGKCGIKSNVWTGRLILIALSRIFSIDDVSPGTVYRTMRRLGKTYRKPGRPRDLQTPSDEVKAGFKEDLAAEIVRYVSTGCYPFWMDESHFTTKTIRGLTWLARGLSVPQVIKPFGKRYTCFGVPGEGGTLHHRYYDRGNTDSMIDFVRSLHDTYGKVLLVMDNASIHKAKRLMDEIGEMGGDIRIIYQPTYSPDPNPVETVWKELKKYVANGLYKKVEDMTGAIDEMILSGTVRMPPLPGYAADATRRTRAAAA